MFEKIKAHDLRLTTPRACLMQFFLAAAACALSAYQIRAMTRQALIGQCDIALARSTIDVSCNCCSLVEAVDAAL